MTGSRRQIWVACNQMFSAAVVITSIVLLVLLLTRAIQGRFVSRLPFFYSYAAYVLFRTFVDLGVLAFLPRYHASVYWFGFLFLLVVEFAVLIEVSDHVFEPYPAIRSLGRLLCGLICAGCLAFYIVPALLLKAPSSQVMLDLVKRTSLTKAFIILVLFAAARIYGLRMGRSITGVLLGFSIYLGVNIANFELAQTYGRALYAPVLRVVAPMAWTLGALVWVVALWSFEPSVVMRQQVHENKRGTAVPLSAQLARFNNLLLKMLER
jgi:hypothetical protein